MAFPTQVLPAAAILLTGLSGAGKTTLARALVRRLTDYGIPNVVLIDGEELRERLSRRYGHSLAEREAVWGEIVDVARREMDAEKVVVIASIAHRISMRTDARLRLKPFFEVHVDCPLGTCASRDPKGHYRRAFAAEYDCFIGVTHPYERSGSVDLRIDTSKVAPQDAEAMLAEKAIEFLSRPQDLARSKSLIERIERRLEEFIIDLPLHWSKPEQRRKDLLAKASSSKAIVHMERASCAQLMVLYGGMDAFLGTKGMFSGMSPLEFLRQSGLFGRNLTWIRDPYGVDFTRGVSEELDSIETLAEWTRRYVQSLPHVRDVHALGYSSGCYGAMMFGHLCGMQSVWAFSPRTARIEQAEAAKAQLRELLSIHNGVTQYHIWYSHENKRDRAFGEYFADCPGVVLHPSREGGSRHYLIRYLAENGALRNILPGFVAADRSNQRLAPPGSQPAPA